MIEYLTDVAAAFVPLPSSGWSSLALFILAAAVVSTVEAIVILGLAAAKRQPFEDLLEKQSAARVFTGLLLLPFASVLVSILCLVGISVAARFTAAATRIAGMT